MAIDDLRKLVKRAGKTGDFIIQHVDRCVGCGNCVKICPVGAWQLYQKKAVIAKDYREKCVECGSCWLSCDADAIEFRYPDGGTGVVWEYG
nr:4Fe-4S binding protein [Candidatus Sigynarchaeota archaeon]